MVHVIERSSVLQHITLYSFLRHFSTHFSSFATCDEINSTENYSLPSPDSCLRMLIVCVVRGSVEKRECEHLVKICIIIPKRWRPGLRLHKH